MPYIGTNFYLFCYYKCACFEAAQWTLLVDVSAMADLQARAPLGYSQAHESSRTRTRRWPNFARIGDRVLRGWKWIWFLGELAVNHGGMRFVTW